MRARLDGTCSGLDVLGPGDGEGEVVGGEQLEERAEAHPGRDGDAPSLRLEGEQLRVLVQVQHQVHLGGTPLWRADEGRPRVP